MKIFIDTANVQQIRDAASMGILDGVTTNPSLMAKEDGTFRDILTEICSIGLSVRVAFPVWSRAACSR